MKAGYEIEKQELNSFVNCMSVCNFHAINKVSMNVWPDLDKAKEYFKQIDNIIGFWKIKNLKK